MPVAGIYDCTISTPLGDQHGRLTLATAGTTLTGSGSGDFGDIAIEHGTTTGDSARWTMQVTRPMPIKADVTATVAGDSLTGEVKAGFFGTFRLTGTRVG